MGRAGPCDGSRDHRLLSVCGHGWPTAPKGEQADEDASRKQIKYHGVSPG